LPNFDCRFSIATKKPDSFWPSGFLLIRQRLLNCALPSYLL
jgi:hypothetical protein